MAASRPHAARRAAPLCLLPGLLLVLALLDGHAVRAVDVYRTQPMVELAPLFPDTVLILADGNLTLDLDASPRTFSLSLDVRFGKDDVSDKALPRVTLAGSIFFTLQQQMLFSFADQGIASCNDQNGAPPTCPALQQDATGPWTFGYQLTANANATTQLTIASSMRNDVPVSFLGALTPFTFVCVGVCSPINVQVPSAPLPANASFTVRFPSRYLRDKMTAANVCNLQ